MPYHFIEIVWISMKKLSTFSQTEKSNFAFGYMLSAFVAQALFWQPGKPVLIQALLRWKK